MAEPTTFKWPEDSPCPLMAVVKANGAYIQQSVVSSIRYQTWQYGDQSSLINDSDATEIGASAGLSPVSTYVFNTLQTDYGWDTSIDTGYNLRFTLPRARLPNGGKWIAVEVWITPASGEDYLAAEYHIDVQHTRGGS